MFTCHRDNFAGFKWVTRISLRAITSGEMIDHSALGVATAQTWARITTFLIDAHLSGCTIGIEDAFGFATLSGISKVFRQTLTDGRTVLFSADGVSTTR